MNCQDIARMLDEREVDGLSATEQADVQAHLVICRDCARDWRIHARLSAAAIPAVPAELRAQYAPQVGGGAGPGARRHSRLIVVGAVVAVAAAAAMLVLRMNGPVAPVAATAVPVQMKPAVPQVRVTAVPAPTAPMADDDSKALADWERRVAEWLAVRDDPDALVTAALLLRTQQREAQRIQALLRRATVLAPDNARIHATAMLLCHALQSCDATPYELALRRLAPDNALGWIGELNRSWRAGDKQALQSALAAMSRARTFDLYWSANILATTAQMQAARVAPPDIDGDIPSSSSDAYAFAIFAGLPMPAYQSISKTCKSATDERTLLECRQIGAAMRAGDTMITNGTGLVLSGSGLPGDSAEARALAQQSIQFKWLAAGAPQKFDNLLDDPEGYLRAFADHPREMDALRAWFEERGIPTEPPADWKP